jgi:ribosomal protein S18 acetylase RimI-like enzyme
MFTIRKGRMKDCKDLLTVYMGTHWADSYTTVEQVKSVHKGVGFKKWGWLVGEMDGHVVGEILFRIEKNPVTGKLGIITDIGVDVRYQKRLAIGTKLTQAAEEVLRKKNVQRVVATSPPEAYNFWMKISYFARGSLEIIRLNPKKIPTKGLRKIKSIQLRSIESLPKSMRFSYIAHPGSLTKLVRKIIDEGQTGKLFEYYFEDKLVGVGALVKEDPKNAQFVADVTKSGIDKASIVIAKTAKAASRWRITNIHSIIPKTYLSMYMDAAKWKTETARDIPVTRLI